MSKDSSDYTELLRIMEQAQTSEKRIEAAQAMSNLYLKRSNEKREAKRRQMKDEAQLHFRELCANWAKRDFWSLWEALNLLVHRHPETHDWSDGVGDLWQLAVTCIGPGGTLRVINPEVKALTTPALAHKYKIRPLDLLSWARAKKISVPKELDAVLTGVEEISSSAGTLSLEERKKKRRRDIRRFTDIAYAEAERVGIDWAKMKLPIGVTKQEFKAVFEQYMRVQPSEKVSQDTFNDDLKDLGITFARGVKNRSNNDLARLFMPKLG